MLTFPNVEIWLLSNNTLSVLKIFFNPLNMEKFCVLEGSKEPN